MKKFTLVLTPALFLTLITGFAQSTGKLELKSGQKLEVKTTVNSTISQEVQGNNMEIVADMNSTTKVDVKERTESNINLVNTISYLNVAVNAMGQDMKFDSDKKDDLEGPIGKQFGGVINKPLEMVMTSNGKLTKDKKPADDQAGNMMMSGMGNDPTTAFEEAFLVVPSGTQAGGSWIDSSDTDGTKKSTRYTIREIKGNDAVVDIKGSLNSSVTKEMMGMEVKTTSTGTMAGEAIVDFTTGIVKNRSVTTEMKGTSEVMGQEIPIASKTTTKTTVTVL